MAEIIEVKTLLVNGKPLPVGYECKSLSYNLGDPEIAVKNAVNGASDVAIHSPNRETALGSIKFNIYPTSKTTSGDSRVYVRSLKKNIASNTIIATSPLGKTIAFVACSCTNAVEFADNPDGSVPLEFMGDKANIS